jgi:hypothetical protein
MLSVAHCRKLLGADSAGKKDEEIEDLRDALYQFAYILVEQEGMKRPVKNEIADEQSTN